MKTLKLFCFPFAGGSATMFNKWRSLMPPFISLHPVELAGRGVRIRENLYFSLNEAICDLYSIIEDEIKDEPYAFFGHSMGALLAYELSLKILGNGLTPPVEVFISGRGANNRKLNSDKMYRQMSDREFESELKDLGGTPDEFFRYPELIEFFLPVLKSDFDIAFTELPVRSCDNVNFPITVLSGIQDNLLETDLKDWGLRTKNEIIIKYFQGGHFYINDQTEEIIACITDRLKAKHILHCL